MLKFALIVVSAVAFTCTNSSSQSRDGSRHLYVSTNGCDRNPCTSRKPCRTIKRAALIATPGTTVHVAPGTYNETVIINRSGTPSARIRYLSDTKWGAKLVGSDTGVIWQLNASYVDIVGFDISGPNSVGIYIGWRDYGVVGYNRILGNYIHDLTISGGCNSSGGAAIVTGQSSSLGHNWIIANRVANIGAAMIGACNTVQGIYIATANDVVANNIVSGVAMGGIQQWHGATESNIANNTVFNCNVGIVMGGGDHGTRPAGSANNLVANNISVNNRFGISEVGRMGSGSRYSNNLVFNNSARDLNISSAVPTATITADPQFVNYNPNGEGDYHLKPASPAIETGISLALVASDFDGRKRPAGRSWDVGAYEHGTSAAAWPWDTVPITK